MCVLHGKHIQTIKRFVCLHKYTRVKSHSQTNRNENLYGVFVVVFEFFSVYNDSERCSPQHFFILWISSDSWICVTVWEKEHSHAHTYTGRDRERKRASEKEREKERYARTAKHTAFCRLLYFADSLIIHLIRIIRFDYNFPCVWVKWSSRNALFLYNRKFLVGYPSRWSLHVYVRVVYEKNAVHTISFHQHSQFLFALQTRDQRPLHLAFTCECLLGMFGVPSRSFQTKFYVAWDKTKIIVIWCCCLQFQHRTFLPNKNWLVGMVADNDQCFNVLSIVSFNMGLYVCVLYVRFFGAEVFKPLNEPELHGFPFCIRIPLWLVTFLPNTFLFAALFTRFEANLWDACFCTVICCCSYLFYFSLAWGKFASILLYSNPSPSHWIFIFVWQFGHIFTCKHVSWTKISNEFHFESLCFERFEETKFAEHIRINSYFRQAKAKRALFIHLKNVIWNRPNDLCKLTDMNVFHADRVFASYIAHIHVPVRIMSNKNSISSIRTVSL